MSAHLTSPTRIFSHQIARTIAPCIIISDNTVFCPFLFSIWLHILLNNASTLTSNGIPFPTFFLIWIQAISVVTPALQNALSFISAVLNGIVNVSSLWGSVFRLIIARFDVTSQIGCKVTNEILKKGVLSHIRWNQFFIMDPVHCYGCFVLKERCYQKIPLGKRRE